MKYGLIGKTLVHSYSKEIHEALGKYDYRLYSLSEDEMTDFINKRDFDGLNITIPYKKDVIPLCDEVSELASVIGAVNTLYWDSSSRKLIGHNTDYEGFLYAASRAGISFWGKTVLILGSGGTSLMVRKAAADSGVKQIYIASRRAASDKIAKRFSEIQLTYPQLPTIADKVDVIVNTTPVGTYPRNLETVINLADFPNCEAVMDVTYNPFRTKLLLDAERAGLKYTNGLPMLVAQATAAAGYFLGSPGAFEHENERILSDLRRKMQNIALIGMPGSGKTTIGQILTKLAGKRFVDMDSEISELAGLSVPEIFAQYGEERFRALETEAAKKLGKEHGLIIGTGGGAVLKSENVDALRQNALVIHVTRPVENLPTDGRPLSENLTVLQDMEKKRMPIYKAAADFTFDNGVNCSEEELTEKVRAQLLGLFM